MELAELSQPGNSMYIPGDQLQLSICPRPHGGTRKTVQPTRASRTIFSYVIDEIKHCAVGLLPVLFSSFPCTITANNSGLPRLSQRDPIPRLSFGSLDTLLPDGSIARELRTFVEVASPEP